MESVDLLTKQKATELKHYCEDGPIPAQYNSHWPTRSFDINVNSEDYLKANRELIKLGGDVWKLKQYKEWAEAQLDADRQAFAKMEYGTPGRRPVVIKIKDKITQAWFLGWTTEGEGYPHAIIEYRDGKVGIEYIDCLTFHDWYTDELNEDDEGDKE